MKKVQVIVSSILVTGFIGAIGINSAMAGEWFDKVKIGADLRYRHENIVKQKDQLVGTDVETYDEIRDRQRVRFRLKVEGKVNDNWKIKTRLSTGGNEVVDIDLGDLDGRITNDNNSTNQTLDNNFDNKSLNLDQAYVEGKLFGMEEPIVTALLGKMSNPFVNPGKDQLLWDGDVTPEGIAAKFAYPVGDMELFSTIAGFWLDEDKASIDTMFYGAQVGAKAKFGDIKVMVGGGLNAITNMPVYNNINVGEAFLEVSTKLAGQAVKVFGHYAQNGGRADNEFFAQGSTATEPEKVDASAMAFGAQYGKAKKAGSYQAKVMYKKYGHDYGFVYIDSDFAGGVTDSSGLVLAAAYAPWDKTVLGVTYFINTYEDTNTGIYSPLNYNRLQVDLKLSY